MKKAVLAILLSIVLPCLPETFAQCLPVKELKADKLAFGPGETLEYTIHYNWGVVNADVASGIFRLEAVSDGLYNVRLFAQNAKFYDPVFKMREDFRCWFYPDGMVPVRFTRDTKEGSWFSTNDYAFMWDSEPPYIEAALNSRRRGPRNVRLPLKECNSDVLTLFYYARNLDMDRVEEGKLYPITFAVDNDICNIYFIFKGRETVNVKGVGRIKALKFRIKLAQGDVFGDDVEAAGDAWFSDDDNHVLVYFESPIKVGKIKGRLKNYSGLKHEFSSLVK